MQAGMIVACYMCQTERTQQVDLFKVFCIMHTWSKISWTKKNRDSFTVKALAFKKLSQASRVALQRGNCALSSVLASRDGTDDCRGG